MEEQQPRRIHQIFEEMVSGSIPPYEQFLRKSIAELQHDLAELTQCREELNAPEIDDEVSGFADDTGQIGTDLQDQLSGKRFPDLQHVLELFADGLRKQKDIVERSGVTPELCVESAEQDRSMGRVIFVLDKIYRGARDAWLVYVGTAVGLCQHARSLARTHWPPQDVALFEGLFPEEFTPADPASQTSKVLSHLVAAFLRTRSAAVAGKTEEEAK